ncbi:hypothetical protein [Flavobacterium sp. K5-23]|nr:hypothetical protein [Flavobacterium sp. K5-23]
MQRKVFFLIAEKNCNYLLFNRVYLMKDEEEENTISEDNFIG